MIESRLYRATLGAAEAFVARKLWLEYANDECFAVVVPGEEHPMFVAIMGQGGEEFGLVLFRGPSACGNVMDTLDRDPRDMDGADATAFVGFSTGRFDEAPPFGRRFLAKARFAGRGSSIVPCFLAKDAGRQPRALVRSEVETLLYALKGILKAKDMGLVEPEPLRPSEGALTLVIAGDPLDPEVSCERRRYGSVSAATGGALPEMPAGLSDLPRIPGRWLIGWPTLPVTIEDDDRTVRMVMVVDEDSELILVGHATHSGLPEAVGVVHEAFLGRNALEAEGIPREILVANRELFNALWPGLDSLGVRCEYEPAVPLLDEIFQSLLDTFARQEPEPERGDEDPDAVPRADDLEGWKHCDRQLHRRAQARLAEAVGTSRRATTRYFGHAEAAGLFLDGPDAIMSATRFYEWCWLDYRATKRSTTLAEKMLSGTLPRPERILLEARVEATPSIFKVERIERGTSLTLLDLLFGGEVVVHDRSLSETADLNLSVPARVFPAGDFHFMSLLGPPLAALRATAAIEFLEDSGLQLTREGVKAAPHLFGRLWTWMTRSRARGAKPHLVNTDGDDICFHTATYLVTDEGQARAAIAARQDIEWVAEDVDYLWFREVRPATPAMLGDIIDLATLSIVGDELLVEVNSAERLESIRAWLDSVPGIEFHTVRKRSVEEVMKAGPAPDDQLGHEEVAMTPELAADVRDMMRGHYMGWLDTPIPALDGKTPRETCRTAQGRKRVARMIRAMPKPVAEPTVDVDVPRREMFDALGLDEDE